MNYLQRAERLMNRINELAAISEDENCITRVYGSKAFLAGRNKIEQWMDETGLQTRVDNIGNVRGRLPSPNPAAKTFVIASHIDTVNNAGRFDGSLGVLAGLDIIEQLMSLKTHLPFHIELIGFCDEEGCRFHTTYLGSKVVAGCFDNGSLALTDNAGISLGELVRENGGNINQLGQDAIPRHEWLGYYEIHIEQGPVLYEKNIPIALVKAIAGQYRAVISFIGEAGHAGTVPMNMRKDALACAAEFILVTEAFAKQHEGELLATVGKLDIAHAAANVIPGEVHCSIDFRSEHKEFLSFAIASLKTLAHDIGQKRNCKIVWNPVQYNDPVKCDEELTQLLSASIAGCNRQLVELVSGAGHDAVPVSTVSPVAMLFVRCFKGISHNPLENVEPADIAAAIEVSDNFMQLLLHNIKTK